MSTAALDVFATDGSYTGSVLSVRAGRSGSDDFKLIDALVSGTSTSVFSVSGLGHVTCGNLSPADLAVRGSFSVAGAATVKGTLRVEDAATMASGLTLSSGDLQAKIYYYYYFNAINHYSPPLTTNKISNPKIRCHPALCMWLAAGRRLHRLQMEVWWRRTAVLRPLQALC